MKEKLASRKLWAFIGTAITLIGSVFTGDATWAQVAWPLVLALMAYLGIQGAVDYQDAKVKPADVPPATFGDALTAVGNSPARELPSDPRKWQFPKDVPGIIDKFNIKIKL